MVTGAFPFKDGTGTLAEVVIMAGVEFIIAAKCVPTW
jgi:hypothetical protein